MGRAYFKMHVAIILWGFTGILGKAITLSEGMIVWYRMLLTAVSLALILLFRRKLTLPSFRSLLRISLIGLLVCIHWVTFYGAIKASNVSVTLSCFSSVALFSSFLEPVYEKRRPHLSHVLLGVFVIAGIVLIFSAQQLYTRGILLSLFSAFLAAWFTVLNKREAGRFDASFITFYEMLTGFLVLSLLLPIYFFYGNQHFEIPGPKDMIYLLLLSLLCTTLAFTLSMQALQKVNAFTMNLSVNLEPVYSILLAMVIFRENRTLNPGFYAGTAIILLAVVIHSFFQWRTHRRDKLLL